MIRNLILASNSPRRKELFSLFGWPFVVIPADIDECQMAGEAPQDYVRRLAREKAIAIAQSHTGLVIAADTIVVDGDEVLGKPEDAAAARKMLVQLRNRIHKVYTGITLMDSESGQTYHDTCCTEVPMRDYSDEEIEAYIKTGDPMDKAGAYAIQHAGFHPVEKLSGCYASVMGLPLCHVSVGFKALGMEFPAALPERCQGMLNYSCPYVSQVLGADWGLLK